MKEGKKREVKGVISKQTQVFPNSAFAAYPPLFVYVTSFFWFIPSFLPPPPPIDPAIRSSYIGYAMKFVLTVDGVLLGQEIGPGEHVKLVYDFAPGTPPPVVQGGPNIVIQTQPGPHSIRVGGKVTIARNKQIRSNKLEKGGGEGGVGGGGGEEEEGRGGVGGGGEE